MIAEFAIAERLPVMMHAAETAMEVAFLRDGSGPFAEGLRASGNRMESAGSVHDSIPERPRRACKPGPCWPTVLPLTMLTLNLIVKLERAWPTVRNRTRSWAMESRHFKVS